MVTKLDHDGEPTDDRMLPLAELALGEGETRRAARDLADELAADHADAFDAIQIFETSETEAFRSAGGRTLRSYGESTRVAFSRPSLDLSGFDDDAVVDVYATGGAILLVDAEILVRDAAFLGVHVHMSTSTIPTDVADVFRRYNANVELGTLTTSGDDGLVFKLSTPSIFERVTTRGLRAFGDSTGLTIPVDALTTAGLGVDDDVDMLARPGAIMLRDASRDVEP